MQNLVTTATQHQAFVNPWFWSNLITIHVQYTGIYICLVLLLYVSLPEHVSDHILIKIQADRCIIGNTFQDLPQLHETADNNKH